LELQGRESLENCRVPGSFSFFKSCDMRYVGQGHEINVAVLEGDLEMPGVEQLKSRFNAEYKRNYGYVDEKAALEIVTLKLIATCESDSFALRIPGKGSGGEDPKKGVRKIYIPEEKGFFPCPVYDRDGLYPGFQAKGPAIVEERTSSTVVLPDDRLEVDELGNLVITVESEKR